MVVAAKDAAAEGEESATGREWYSSEAAFGSRLDEGSSRDNRGGRGGQRQRRGWGRDPVVPFSCYLTPSKKRFPGIQGSGWPAGFTGLCYV